MLTITSRQVKCPKTGTSGQQLSSLLAICGWDFFSSSYTEKQYDSCIELYGTNDRITHATVTNGGTTFVDTLQGDRG